MKKRKIVLLESHGMPPKEMSKEELIGLVNASIDKHKAKYPNGIKEIVVDSMMKIETQEKA